MAIHALVWPMATLLAAGAIMAAFRLGFDGSGIGLFGCAVLSILILTLRDVFESSKTQAARQATMQQAARRLQLSFRPTAPFNVLGWPDSFRLTRDAMRIKQAIERARASKWVSALQPASRNVMEGVVEDVTVAVFDYECDRSRSNDTTIQQTVFAVRSAKLTSPHFALIPASWWSHLLERLARRAGLDHGYRLITEGAATPGPFDERLFTLLGGQACMEAGEGFLLLYRRNKFVQPEDVDDFLATGLEVYAMLAGAAAD